MNWTLWDGVSAQSKKIRNVYIEQTHIAQNHLKLYTVYDFPLHNSRQAQTDVIYSYNIDIHGH